MSLEGGPERFGRRIAGDSAAPSSGARQTAGLRQRAYFRWLADRNWSATAAGSFLSNTTAAFICWIAGMVISALTELSVCANAGPSLVTSDFLTTGTAFWKPN